MTQRQEAQARLIALMKALENDPDDATMGMYIYSTLGRQMLLAIANDQQSEDNEVITSIRQVSIRLQELLVKYKEIKAEREMSVKSAKPMIVN